MSQAYEETINFIASGTSPESVAEFRPSEEARGRVMDLIRREKTGRLSEDEQSELRHCLAIEHIMRLCKARARKILTLARE